MNGQAVANVGGFKLLRVWRMEDGSLELDDPLPVLAFIVSDDEDEAPACLTPSGREVIDDAYLADDLGGWATALLDPVSNQVTTARGGVFASPDAYLAALRHRDEHRKPTTTTKGATP